MPGRLGKVLGVSDEEVKKEKSHSGSMALVLGCWGSLTLFRVQELLRVPCAAGVSVPSVSCWHFHKSSVQLQG